MRARITSTCADPIESSWFRTNARRTLLSLIGLLVILMPGIAVSSTAANEYAIKAAYIYNILRFVSWKENTPLASTPTLNICLSGQAPIKPYLAPITDKTISNRHVRVISLDQQDNAPLCHLVYLADNDDNKADIQQYLNNQGTIIIGDNRTVLPRSSMFSFYIENNKVRLGANRPIIGSSSVQVSSMLIEVCQLYGDGNEPQ